MAFKKILCAIDFSTGSQQAMRAAVRLAEEHNAYLVLIHVWHVPAIASGGELGFIADSTIQQQVDDAKQGLDDACAAAVRLGAKHVSSKLVLGVPWREVVDFARSDPAFDLVVTGTHGRTGVARVLLGSVAEAVVRHAPCPVLVVRADGGSRPFANVLCPVDFSASSSDAMTLAGELARPPGRIALMQVLEIPVAYSIDAQLPGLPHKLTAQAAGQLRQCAEQLTAKAAVPVTYETHTGHADAQILAALDVGSFDLVVTGSHGHSALGRLMLGSVSEQVVRRAGCSVLVARHRR